MKKLYFLIVAIICSLSLLGQIKEKKEDYSKIYSCYYMKNVDLLEQNGKFRFYDNKKAEFKGAPFYFKNCSGAVNIDGDICYINFNDPLIVFENEKFGVIDGSGKVLLPFKYDKILEYGQDKVMLFGCLDGKCGFLNNDGKVTGKSYNDIIGVWEDYFLVVNESGALFIDRKGNELKNILTVNGPYNSFHKNCRFALFYSDGKQITDYKYDFINEINGIVIASINKKVALLDTVGNELTGFVFDEIGFPDPSFKTIDFILNDKEGLLNMKGEIITPAEYEFIYNHEGYKPAKKNELYGFLDDMGKLVIPHSYNDANAFSENGLAGVMKDGKWGFINMKGDVVIPLKYDYVDYFRGEYAIVKLNDISGKVDKEGKEYW